MKTKSNNSGFSLVELIVVIAIMAVLVGVLAPTLIGNIEKSRESKDLQNLDTLRQGAITALAEESCYKEVVPATPAGGGTATNSYAIAWDASNKKVTVTAEGSAPAATNFGTEFATIVTADPTMSSNAAGATGNKILLSIENTGAVSAKVVDSSNATVKTTKTKDSSGAFVDFESK